MYNVLCNDYYCISPPFLNDKSEKQRILQLDLTNRNVITKVLYSTMYPLNCYSQNARSQFKSTILCLSSGETRSNMYGNKLVLKMY